MRYDAIIVGAGTAGATAARYLAKNDFSVCLLDMKAQETIGEKVCGDAIAKHHFDLLKLDHPKGDELLCKVEGLAVYSPDKQSVLRVKDGGVNGFTVDRHKFGQRLLHDAMSAGATLLDQTRALEPVTREGGVTGVTVEDMCSRQLRTLEAPITIDASGYAGALRSKMPPEFGIEKEINAEDMIVAYREIRAGVDFTSDLSEIHISQEIASGGYYWLFDRGHGEVNVGLGVQMKTGHPNPKEQLYRHVLTQNLFKNSKILRGGGGIVPTRRPLPSLAANGIMFIGDAACLVNPIHGGGIGPSMLSGKLAADTADVALRKEDTSREVLWGLNTSYMKMYGAKQAGLDVFRLLLQSISDEELNFGIKQQLVTPREVLGASMEGELGYSITDKAQKVFRGIGRLGFLNRLRKTADLMHKARLLYLNYPCPDEFQSWKSRAESIFSQKI